VVVIVDDRPSVEVKVPLKTMVPDEEGSIEVVKFCDKVFKDTVSLLKVGEEEGAAELDIELDEVGTATDMVISAINTARRGRGEGIDACRCARICTRRETHPVWNWKRQRKWERLKSLKEWT
jgi:hypothetical protein